MANVSKIKLNDETYNVKDAEARKPVDEELAKIRNEGSTQASAIGLKGQEVLESIPEDYAALSGDVTALKSASDKLNTQSSIISDDIYGFAPVTKQITVKGITINGSGKLLELNGTATSGVIISLTGSKIRAINATAPNAEMLTDSIPAISGHLYRISSKIVRGSYIQNIALRAYDTSGNSYGVTLPGFGYNFIATENAIGTIALQITKNVVLDNVLLEYKIEDITDNDNWEPINLSLSYGYYNSDGTIAETTDTRKEKYTNRIEVIPGDKLKIEYTVGSGQGWAAYMCYGADGAVIGSRHELSASGAYSSYDDVLIVPDNCYEISFCFRSYDILGCFSIWRNIDINVMLDETRSIRNDVNELQTKGTHVANAFDSYGIKSINHAGYGKLASGYPDNTIPVFLLSKQHGFPIVETDLRLTSDGVPVLLHDTSINRTARNADGSAIEGTVNIANITYEQALQYDFGIAAGEKWAGTKIPSLAEFLRVCMENDLLAYIEIEHTDAMTPEKIAEIIKMTHDAGMLRRVTWIGMNPVDLRNVLLADNAARVGWVLNEQITSAHEATYKSLITPYNEAFIDCRHNYFTPAGTLTKEEIEAEVTLLKSWDCALEVWTPDQEQQIKAVNSYCTGYTSNYFNANIVLRKAAQDRLYLESPNGTIYKVTVSDAGTLSVTT